MDINGAVPPGCQTPVEDSLIQLPPIDRQIALWACPVGVRVILDGPSDTSTEIRVGEQFGYRLIARKGDESDLKAGLSGMFHGRDAIGVVCCQGDQIDRAIG